MDGWEGWDGWMLVLTAQISRAISIIKKVRAAVSKIKLKKRTGTEKERNYQIGMEMAKLDRW